MGIEPRLVKREAQPYACIHEQLGRDELAEIVPQLLPELLAFLEKHRIHLTGAPLIRYLVVDYGTGGVEVDVGAPVAATTLPASGRVRSGEIPAGTFATVIHRGAYDALMKTTGELLDWAKQNDVEWQVVETRNVTRWSARVEHYLVGPPVEPDPKSWQTEIAILVSADDARVGRR